ncbi:hypothetical protein AC1031_009933 [Aphanomyces cochlioides]|nr:hypothetical protein AC1031_009933 [Aphanomyces cochlioides]
MIYTLSSVSLDEEIQDLLTTVFYNEFCHDMDSSDHEKNVPVPTTTSKRRCKVDQCANAVVSKGRCIRHGGGGRCSVEGCETSSKREGLCWKHGGSRKCQREGCKNLTKSRGRCWTHGGGKQCATDACERTALRGGRCWAHGGGKRCKVDGCQRPAYERNDNLCVQHRETK